MVCCKRWGYCWNFYTYEVTVAGETRETQDVYSKAVGVNGDRSMVVDLSATNPEGWETDMDQGLKIRPMQ